MNTTTLFLADAVTAADIWHTAALLTAALAAAGCLTLALCCLEQLARTRRQLSIARHAACHDRLTGLANRAGLATAWPTYATAPTVSVLLLDLDGFKPVNDQYGHAAGDQVLATIAARLATFPGLVARLGGDEFAAVTTHPDPAALARRIAELVALPLTLPDGTSLCVTASIGVAPEVGPDLAAGLGAADAAMYRAKTTRTAVAVYHPARDDRPDPAGDPRPAGRVRELATHRDGWQVAA